MPLPLVGDMVSLPVPPPMVTLEPPEADIESLPVPPNIVMLEPPLLVSVELLEPPIRRRSEERGVGNVCWSRWPPIHSQEQPEGAMASLPVRPNILSLSTPA